MKHFLRNIITELHYKIRGNITRHTLFTILRRTASTLLVFFIYPSRNETLIHQYNYSNKEYW